MIKADHHRDSLPTKSTTLPLRAPEETAERTSREHWIAHAFDRLRCIWQQRGFWGTTRFVLSRIYRRQVNLVFEAVLTESRPSVAWKDDEQLLQFGPENVDREMSPELEHFLGGAESIDNIRGVRRGDRLFVVRSENHYLHRGYIMFRTRERRLIGQPHDAPLIGYCFTALAARGRGLYRRALTEELNYLQKKGFARAAIATSPENGASRKAIESAGFSLACESRVWIVLNIFCVRCLTSQERSRWAAFLI